MAEGKVARENHISHAWIAIFHHHTAPAEDKTLTERDAMAIFEELLEAMNQAYMLGLKLNLPSHELDAIRKTNPDPRECLLHCIPEEQLLNHCYSQASLVLYLKMTWTKVVNFAPN